jgi:outer membrane protein TolC
MNRKSFFLVLTLFAGSSGYAQQLRIEECYEKARANYPLIKQYELIEQSRDYTLSLINRVFLPQFQMSAKATYQSEVTKIPIDFSKLLPPGALAPEIPVLNKDQYGVQLEVNQILWDGGLVDAKRQGVRAKIEADEKALEAGLYAVRERVNQLFFGILLTEAMAEQTGLFQAELQRVHDQIASLVESGLASKADLDAVKVEQVKIQQGLTQILYNRSAFLDMLSAFIGEKIDGDVTLQTPDVGYSLSREIRRPELAMFDAQIRSLDVEKKEINADLMPKLSLFLAGGYGRPGLNMLKTEFSAY